MERMFLAVIIAGSLMASGCSQEPKPAASTTPESMEAQAQQAVADGQQMAAEANSASANVVNNAVEQARILVAQAKEMLDSGKFNEAINLAQQVLNMDPNNVDAKNILEVAKARLAATVQEKAGDLQDNVMNKVNAFGN